MVYICVDYMVVCICGLYSGMCMYNRLYYCTLYSVQVCATFHCIEFIIHKINSVSSPFN